MHTGIALTIALSIKGDSHFTEHRIKMDDIRNLTNFFVDKESLDIPNTLPPEVGWHCHIISGCINYVLKCPAVYVELHFPYAYNLLYKELMNDFSKP